VVRGIEFDSREKAEGYLLADNHQPELGGWDTPGLIEMLQDLNVKDSLKGTGYTGGDIDDLLVDMDRFDPYEDQKKPNAPDDDTKAVMLRYEEDEYEELKALVKRAAQELDTKGMAATVLAALHRVA
jgi:hypothetical protein